MVGTAYHYIYKITRHDGRYYIGMHSTRNLDDGYFGSGRLIRRSIKKYGLEKHHKEIIEFCESRDHLKKREAEIITKQIVDDPKCMNLKLGGEGGWSHTNGNHDAKVKGGKACIEKQGSNLRHHLQFLNENSTYRSKCAENSRIAIANVHKKYPNGVFFGKKHTEETKLKMSIEAKNRVGSKNSQYGTRWINRDGVIKKVNKENLDKYLNMGYKLGRK